jgi:hypothetical protein
MQSSNGIQNGGRRYRKESAGELRPQLNPGVRGRRKKPWKFLRSQIKRLNLWAGDIAQWFSVCLAYMRA